MKERWLPLVGLALTLVACAPDTTLESLVPRASLAVVWIERPEWIPPQWTLPIGGLPRALLGPGPWAASVHQGTVPGFRLYVSLKDEASWPALEEWARETGGLEAVKVGRYAALSSPGLPTVVPLSSDQRFRPGDLGPGEVKLFLDTAVVEAWVDRMGWKGLPLPWDQVRSQVAGLSVTVSPKDGGLELVARPEFRPGPWKTWIENLAAPPGLGKVATEAPREGLTASFALPPEVVLALGGLRSDPGWKARWAALVPSLGPRGALVLGHRADGTWSWAGALESADPQAVRQGLKALVAGGDAQAVFPWVAEDNDTPVIYQDHPGLGGVVTSLVLGSQKVVLGYGNDRVAFASGSALDEALRAWRRAPTDTRHRADGSWALVRGNVDGLKASVRVRVEGRLEASLTIAREDLAAWGERFPQVFLRWLSGEGGWTVFEP